MMKVKMKISGGFRCQDGADDFAIILSFISTAKKRGWNVIHALTQEPQSLILHAFAFACNAICSF
jgi:transposase